jgi:hypothetical protein
MALLLAVRRPAHADRQAGVALGAGPKATLAGYLVVGMPLSALATKLFRRYYDVAPLKDAEPLW